MVLTARFVGFSPFIDMSLIDTCGEGLSEEEDAEPTAPVNKSRSWLGDTPVEEASPCDSNSPDMFRRQNQTLPAVDLGLMSFSQPTISGSS